MTTLSKSPDRYTFQRKSYEEKLKEDPADQNALGMIEMYKKWEEQASIQEDNPEWRKNNMEYDMRTCDWMLEKIRSNNVYAQNLYCAMCNREFQKLEVLPVLKEQRWSCSWRYAGGIVADMRQEGDYIDWYCSGIRDNYNDGYVSEGVVTEEIKEDLKKLGWIVLDDM